MPDSEIIFMSGSELATLVKQRKLSPLEVTRAFLDRIDAVNPRLNAFITVTRDHALTQAEQAAKEIAAGRYRGPLHGLPYAPKDILATKGILTTNGSKSTADWVPDYESTITERLNSAGAILIGKLHLVEFAMGSHTRSPFGITRNPWHLDHSPSGSSSGPGAAVAACMTPLAIGTDTGGSIRKPAHSCGIVGLKPTYGRVSRYGVTALSWSLDHAGPMTRTVADAAMMLQAIAGPDPHDDTAAANPVPDYLKAMTGDVKGIRIGVPKSDFFDGFQPQVLDAVQRALRLLTGLGAQIVDIDVRNVELAGPASAVIRLSEAASFHETRLAAKADLLEPLVRTNLEAGSFYSAVDYIRAMRMRTTLTGEMRRIFESCDVIATPVANPAPRLDAEFPPDGAPKSASAPDTFNLANMTGLPAIVLPCGFTSQEPLLPIGIQFHAKPFDEAMLFRLGGAYEAATDWHKRRPPLS